MLLVQSCASIYRYQYYYVPLPPIFEAEVHCYFLALEGFPKSAPPKAAPQKGTLRRTASPDRRQLTACSGFQDTLDTTLKLEQSTLTSNCYGQISFLTNMFVP